MQEVVSMHRPLHSAEVKNQHPPRPQGGQRTMAEVNQRKWKIPGQRTKRLAWGYTLTVNGKRTKSYRSEWSKEQAQEALAKALLQIEAPKPQASGITFAQAVDRYLATKARKRSIGEDKRQLEHLKSALGADTPLSQ